MGKALFKLTYEQLKENFVRNRFGEQEYYEKEDIEEWLAAQRKADRPELEENGDGMWNHYLSKLAMSNVFDEAWLFDCMFKFASSAESILEQGYGESEDQLKLVQRIKPLLSVLHSSKRVAEIFYCHSLGVIVFIPVPAEMAFMGIQENITDQTHVALKPFGENPGADSFQLFDAIFATWLRGLAKAKEARDFLCDLLAADVAKTRAEAEKDFDEAVAVSEDGKKIVKAHQVVVYDQNKPHEVIRFHGENFRARKILRLKKIIRDEKKFMMSDERTIENILRYLRYNSNGPLSTLIVRQIFAKLKFNKDANDSTTILFAEINNCPDPLPEGGERIIF
ncbi:MAG: hypothetical protein V1928_00400 [Parcubacteria group bacterium]